MYVPCMCVQTMNEANTKPDVKPLVLPVSRKFGWGRSTDRPLISKDDMFRMFCMSDDRPPGRSSVVCVRPSDRTL